MCPVVQKVVHGTGSCGRTGETTNTNSPHVVVTVLKEFDLCEPLGIKLNGREKLAQIGD